MLKVLLVDDEYHVIHHISTLLSQIDFCEFNIIKTTSAPEALQIIASSHIDLAFLDINMPKVSGLQIANLLHNQWPDCQLIFLTAYEVFDYIYEANQFRNAIYLLKSESDATILEKIKKCALTLMQERESKIRLSDIQKKEKLLLLLQEQQLLREMIHGNFSGSWKDFIQKIALDIRFSFDKNIYLMLMHIKYIPSSYDDTFFYLEKMEYLLGNLFRFSFLETERGVYLWIFQEKEIANQEISWFKCLKDTMDSFLDICIEKIQQPLSLCLLQEKISWEHLSRSYQFLYDSYYEDNSMLSMHSSAVRIIENTMSITPKTPDSYNKNHTTLQSQRLTSMKQALYQGNRDLFLTELHNCRQYCTSVKSMHHIGAIRLYFSIALIYLDYIEHYQIQQQVALEIALYPLYYLNDFSNWELAFNYLQQLGKVLFTIAQENNSDRTTQLIASIQNYVQTHLSDNLNLSIIADYVNYNESHISRIFKRHTGVNLSEYITSCRIDYAKKLLLKTEDTIQVISQKAGFNTSQYFSSTFRKSTGMSPQEYRLRINT